MGGGGGGGSVIGRDGYGANKDCRVGQLTRLHCDVLVSYNLVLEVLISTLSFLGMNS